MFAFHVNELFRCFVSGYWYQIITLVRVIGCLNSLEVKTRGIRSLNVVYRLKRLIGVCFKRVSSDKI